jgi:hypothetical protein
MSVQWSMARFGFKMHRFFAFHFFIFKITKILDLKFLQIKEKSCHLDSNEYSKSIYNLNLQNIKKTDFEYEFAISTILKITCLNGYRLVGSAQIICEKNDQGGEWNQVPPTCKLGNIF